MPQMMPLSWLLLMVMFSLTFMMFNIMNYYSTMQKTNTYMKKKNPIKKTNWKW